MFNRYIPIEYLHNLLYYNINDGMATLVLFRHSYSEIIQRANITKKYNINVLTLSRSSTAERMLVNFYLKKSNEDYKDVKNRIDLSPIVPLREVVDPKIEFNDVLLKDLVNEIKNNVVGVDKNFKKALFMLIINLVLD